MMASIDTRYHALVDSSATAQRQQTPETLSPVTPNSMSPVLASAARNSATCTNNTMMYYSKHPSAATSTLTYSSRASHSDLRHSPPAILLPGDAALKYAHDLFPSPEFSPHGIHPALPSFKALCSVAEAGFKDREAASALRDNGNDEQTTHALQIACLDTNRTESKEHANGTKRKALDTETMAVKHDEAPLAKRSTSQPSEQERGKYRRPIRRVYCTSCNDCPEGFRGEHELRRHMHARHSALIKRWVCKEPDHASSPDAPRLLVPLSSCKACLMRKPYGAYYNAAAHLRRAHFNPQKSGVSGNSDWPSMAFLKDWMQELHHTPAASSSMNVIQWGAGSTATSPSDSGEDVQDMAITAAGAPCSPTDTSSSNTNHFPLSEEGTRCPYPQCGRVLRDLAAHMLTHQAERPEKCPVASCAYNTKGFARKYDRNRHSLTHYHGRITCPFCGLDPTGKHVFSRADVFKRHLASVHHIDQSSFSYTSTASGSPGSGTASASRAVYVAASAPAYSAASVCSICVRSFITPHDYYEHLDECVLKTLS